MQPLADRAIAGDICAIGRLGSAETGDTVSDKANPLLIAPWDMPEPLLPLAVQAATRGDEDALARFEVDAAGWRDRFEEVAGQRPRLAGSGSTWFVEGAFPGDGRVVVHTTPASA